MANQEPSKRHYRTRDEILESYDLKIAYHKKCIETLEAKKQTTLHPKRGRKPDEYKLLLKMLKESGKTPDEIAQLLQKEI